MSGDNWVDPWTNVVHLPDEDGESRLWCAPDVVLTHRWLRTTGAPTCSYCAEHQRDPSTVPPPFSEDPW